MGLDITAYSRLEHVGKHGKDPERNEGEPGELDDWCYYDGHVQAFAYDCFPRSFRGIPILGTRHVGSGSPFIEGGCFAITEKTETLAFRAGSYSGYNHWRGDLAAQFNPAPMTFDPRTGPAMTEPDPELPFYELIWFADNEGSIGPEAAADLLADFREHADRYVVPHPSEGAWRKDGETRYQLWTRACELAADGGLIRFH